MKKKVNKKRVARIIIFSIIFALIGVWVFVLAYSKPVENPETNFVYDDKELFSDTQEMNLNAQCEYVQDKYNVKVYVHTCGQFGLYAENDGEDFMNEHDLDYDESIVVVIINAANFEVFYGFDIYTFGPSANKISGNYKSGEIHKILYCEGGDLILTDSSVLAEQGLIEIIEKIGFAYAWILADLSWWIICGVSLLIGCIIAFIVIKVIRKSYLKERKVENYQFSTNTNLDLRIKEDTFIRKNVTFVRIERSHSTGSGGRSGGFGGGFSGGRSGGGGGIGHRGGRR